MLCYYTSTPFVCLLLGFNMFISEVLVKFPVWVLLSNFLIDLGMNAVSRQPYWFNVLFAFAFKVCYLCQVEWVRAAQIMQELLELYMMQYLRVLMLTTITWAHRLTLFCWTSQISHYGQMLTSGIMPKLLCPCSGVVFRYTMLCSIIVINALPVMASSIMPLPRHGAV